MALKCFYIYFFIRHPEFTCPPLVDFRILRIFFNNVIINTANFMNKNSGFTPLENKPSMSSEAGNRVLVGGLKPQASPVRNKFLSGARGDFLTGFTKLELFITIAVLVIVLAIVIFSVQISNAKGRDITRISNVMQLGAIIEAQSFETPNSVLTGCDSQYSLTTACTGPGKILQFEGFSDPKAGGGNPCLGSQSGQASQAVCGYSISASGGQAGASVYDYQICFYLERGIREKNLAKGLYNIQTGLVLKAGCN